MAAVDDRQKKVSPFCSIKWFVFCYYLTCCAVWGALSHNVAIARTLEKRFGLSATQSGFLQSMNDIVNMILVLFIGYLGRAVNKAVFLGVLCMIGGVGSLLFALPYPLYPVALQLANGTRIPQLCTDTELVVIDDTCEENTQAASNSAAAYTMLLAASGLLGFASSGLGVLSITYLDENVPKKEVPFYIGIISSANTIGPLLGFLLAFVTLAVPEDLKESDLPNDSDQFIGCWWLSFVIWGALTVIGGAGMLLCPKHLPHYYEQKALEEKERQRLGVVKETKKKKTPKELFQETLENLRSVFTNVPYMLLVCSTLFAYYLVPGLYGQVPKYLVIQFRMDASLSSIYTGVCGALILAIALVGFGWFIKVKNLQLRGATHLLIFSIIGIMLSVGGMMPWECEQGRLAGVVDANQDIPYYPSCAVDQNCNCTGVAPMCSPVDDISFITPCNAGCTSFNITDDGAIFTDCHCVRGVAGNDSTLGQGYVQGGMCEKPACNGFIPFLVFFAFLNFFSAATRLSAVILQLRFVKKDMRPFAIGLSSFIHNGLAFVPGPILFGAIFDSVCLLWQQLECGERGACIRYNMDDYRTYMHGITLGSQAVSLLLIAPMYAVIRPMFAVQASADEQLFGGNDTKETNNLNGISTIAEKNNHHLNGYHGQGGTDNLTFTYSEDYNLNAENMNTKNEITEL